MWPILFVVSLAAICIAALVGVRSWKQERTRIQYDTRTRCSYQEGQGGIIRRCHRHGEFECIVLCNDAKYSERGVHLGENVMRLCTDHYYRVSTFRVERRPLKTRRGSFDKMPSTAEKI